ncbi:MAG: HAMP domain-containing protein [Burkholderiales bacterium]|nr:HAMP domain-containing protein [Burkholderiales bacterium]
MAAEPFASGGIAERATASRGWQRLDRLRVKLFVAIAGANMALALVTYGVFSWSFDQGFVEYLNRADEARLTPLISRLAEIHEQRGGWRWLAEDTRRWIDVTRAVIGMPRQRREPPPSTEPNADRGGAVSPDTRPSFENARAGAPPGPGTSPSTSPGSPAPAASTQAAALPSAGPAGAPAMRPADPLLTIDPRLMLFDANRELLIGRAEMANEAVLKPIVAAKDTIGYLGYVPRLKMVESIEKVYSAQQNRKYAAIGAAMLAAGLLVGAVLAYWLSRRIRRLASGAASLIQGDYGARVAVKGADELAQLAADFNRLGDTLEAARRARQQWIADIAHELRTPLAALRAEIEAMQDGVRPLDMRGLGALAQDVARLSRLVEDLHLLSMSDLGALSYHREPLDLGELIDDVVGAQGHTLRERGIALDCELADDVRVLADGTRLTQVFGNLLQNTLRYTDAPGRLQVRLARRDGQAEVIWQDSAPGVPDAALPRLTDRLFRVDTSRSRAGGGSGLGLAIADAIVKAHDGSLHAQASPLGGVCWTLRLPTVEARVR